MKEITSKSKSNRKYQQRESGCSQIRSYKKKKQGKKTPRLLLKCGCCDQKLEIYYDKESLEINGVNGSLENWREIFLPLLGEKHK